MASLRLVAIAALATGCSAGLRYQKVGSGRVVTTGVSDVAGPGAADPNAGMAPTVALPGGLPRSTYDVRFEVWLPRAAVVDWTLTCGSATQTGAFGETFEAYRERRLVELRRQREEAQRQAAAIGAAVGDAVLGTTTATVAATAPGASAEASATVDGAAVGAAVGASTVSTEVELAPGDVGAGLHRGRTTIVVPDAEAATCALALAPREPDLAGTGQFHVSRQDDSAQRARVEHHKIAIEVRGGLRAQLLTRGADPEARVRQAAALRAQAEAAAAARAQALAIEATARAEAGLAVAQASSRARIQLVATLEARGADRGYRARIDGICRGTRVTLRDRLIARGGDPELRMRLELAADAERARRDAQAAALRAERDRVRAVERAQRQQLEDHRRALALSVRGELSAQLVARGGAIKTMMPAPIDERPGAPPAPGYAWSPGHWEWRGGQWQWVYGYWLGDLTSRGSATPTVSVPSLPTGVTIGVGVTVGAGGTAPPRSQGQDHR